MELHISILQTHGPVPTLTGDPRAAASRPASRAAVKVKAAEERPAREQEAAKPPGPRRPCFPEERGPGGAEAGLGGRHGEQQRPPSAAVTPRPPAGRGSARAVPVSGPAWASREDGARACRAHPVPRASLGAGHTGASQHTPARGVRYARATGGNRSGESRAPPSANRGPVPPGPTARGQVQRESWELGAAGCSPRPRTRGRGQWAPPSPGNDRPGTRPGEQLSLGVPPGRRAQSAVQGADHLRCPGCPRSLPCLRGNLTRWEGPVGRPPDAWGPERRGPALPADQAFRGKASGKGEQGPSPCPLRGKLGDALATPTNE